MSTDKVKAIGVSNYSVKYLEELLAQATEVPAVNPIQNHPFLPQQEIVDLCNTADIHIAAYTPLGRTGSLLFTAVSIMEIARKRRHFSHCFARLAQDVLPASKPFLHFAFSD